MLFANDLLKKRILTLRHHHLDAHIDNSRLSFFSFQYIMDSVQRRERRAKLKQRLQGELEKDLRANEFANELLEEADEDSSIDNYQVTVKLGQNSVTEIEQLKIDLSYNVIGSDYVAETSIRVTQFPVLERIFEEDDCIIGEADDEEIMLEKD